MKDLAALLVPERVRLDVAAPRRRDALTVLGELLGGHDVAASEAVYDDLARREQMGTTGVGNGIAFPHARVETLPALRLAFLRTEEPVDFGALDDRPVDLFFGLAGPPRARRDYLAALATLSYLFRGDEARRQFREVEDAAAAVELFTRLSTSAQPG